MTHFEKMEAMRLRLPGVQNGIIFSLLAEAKASILALTGRDELPTRLDYTHIKLATIAYNRLGIEGQSSYTEGGISLTVDSMPEAIRAEIAPYRLAETRR